MENPNGGISQIGSWEFKGTDGKLYKTEFIADENGYQPYGSHLPTPPPLPPALQRWEDAKNGKVATNFKNFKESRMQGVASASVFSKEDFVDLRQGRTILPEEISPEVDVFSPKLIRFGKSQLPSRGARIRFRPISDLKV